MFCEATGEEEKGNKKNEHRTSNAQHRMLNEMMFGGY